MKPVSYSNIVVYSKLLFCAEQLLPGKVLYNAYSTGKDQLFLGFKSTQTRDFVTLECRFVNGELLVFIHRGEPLANPKKGLIAFKSLAEQSVKKIIAPQFERHFIIEFTNGELLLFKGYGRFGNIIKFTNDNELPEYEDVFRKNIKSDLQSGIAGYLIAAERDRETFEKQFSFLPQSVFEYFDNRTQLFEKLINLKLIFSNDESLKENNRISFEEGRGIEGDRDELLANLNQVAADYAGNYYFRNEKTQKLLQIAAQIKKTKANIRDAEIRLQKLSVRRNFRELGDIILAHASSIGQGVENALLQDLYLGGKITIKLNPLQSVSENAERYYKKEQNAKIESQMLGQRLENSRQQLNTFLAAEQRILQAHDIRSLRSGNNGNNKKQQELKPSQNTLPYKEFEIEGIKIWVGKNAKANDQMLKLAHRNDIWMHARNVQGSHVIIRSAGKNINARIMSYAAGLAAFHSKAKTQELVPVQYTERKFVSKPKNSNAGEVSLIKEQIIDTEPNDGT